MQGVNEFLGIIILSMEKANEGKYREDSPVRTAVIEKSFLTDMLMRGDEVNYHEKIKEYYKVLENQVQKLDTNIGTMLQKHEQDFLNAFKCQMFNLYAQLRDLKKKTDENEVKLKRDEQINTLQKSLEWFREEAVKLGESSQFYRNETEKWKAKAESLEDDRKFLETQLKNTKRKVKNLQHEKEPDKASDYSLKNSTSQSLDKANIKYFPSTKTGEILLELIQKNNFHLEDFLYDTERFFNEIEIKYNDAIKHMKNTLDSEKKKIRNISAHQTSVFFVKSDLESLFLECVEEVRKEVSRRKAQTLATQQFAKRAQTTLNGGRDLMAPSDKRKILELLVSNEQVLIMLYEKLFPYRVSQYGHTSKVEDKIERDMNAPNLEELLNQIPSKNSTVRGSVHQFRGKSVS